MFIFCHKLQLKQLLTVNAELANSMRRIVFFAGVKGLDITLGDVSERSLTVLKVRLSVAVQERSRVLRGQLKGK